jgi:hypothetical protein
MTQRPIDAAFLREIAPAGWALWRTKHLEATSWPAITQSFYRPIATTPDPADTEAAPLHALRVDIYECDSVGAARACVERLTSELQVPGATEARDSGVGDTARVSRQGYTFIFARGVLAIRVASAGQERTPVIDQAQAIDQRLLGRTD